MVQKYSSNIIKSGNFTMSAMQPLSDSGQDVAAFAQSIDRASEKLFGMALDEQNQINQMAALDASNQMQAQLANFMYDQKNGLLQKKGKDALLMTGDKPSAQYVSDEIDKMYKNIEGKLLNQAQRDVFKKQANDLKLRTAIQAQNHIAQESRQYTTDTLTSSADVILTSMSQSLQSGAAFQVVGTDSNGTPQTILDQNMAEIFATNRALAQHLGKPMAWADQKSSQDLQSWMAVAVETKLTQNDVDGAFNIYSKYPGFFSKDMMLKMGAIVQDKKNIELGNNAFKQAITVNKLPAVDKPQGAVVTGDDGKPKVLAGLDAHQYARRQIESNNTHFDSVGKPIEGRNANKKGMGAYGISQIKPDTAEITAKKHGIKWDKDLFFRARTGNKKIDDETIEYNKKLGDLHFADLVERYNGNPRAAMVAYNAGQGVADAYFFGKPVRVTSPSTGKTYTLNPDGIKTQDGLPPNGFLETKNYLKRYDSELSKAQKPVEVKPQTPSTQAAQPQTRVINGKVVPLAGQLSGTNQQPQPQQDQPPQPDTQMSGMFSNPMSAQAYSNAYAQIVESTKNNPVAQKFALQQLEEFKKRADKENEDRQGELMKAMILNGQQAGWNIDQFKPYLKYLNETQLRTMMNFYESKGKTSFNSGAYGSILRTMDKLTDAQFYPALGMLPQDMHASLIKERESRLASTQEKLDKAQTGMGYTNVDYALIDKMLDTQWQQRGIVSKYDRDKHAQRMALVRQAVINNVEYSQLENKKQLTDVEMNKLVSNAFPTLENTSFGDRQDILKLDISNVPKEYTDQAKAALQARGNPKPTDDEILIVMLTSRLNLRTRKDIEEMRNAMQPQVQSNDGGFSGTIQRLANQYTNTKLGMYNQMIRSLLNKGGR